MHWAMQYLGQPWVSGTNDCFAFFRRVQRVHFARDVPFYNVDADDLRDTLRAFDVNPERGNWVETQVPEDGDAVLMSQNRRPSHVGLWLDLNGGGVLHCVKGSGVIFSRRDHLQQMGYSVLGFYRYKGA